MATAANTKPRRKRRFRYTLRALLAFMLFVAVWCAFHANRGRYERDLERELIQAGAKVDSGLDLFTGKARESTSYEQFQRSVFGQRFVRRIDAKHVNLPPDVVQRIWRLPHLQSVTFFDCQLTDEHLRSLGAARELENLILKEDGLSDEGLRGIESLQRMRYVYLHVSGLGDPTLHRLAKLPKVEEIDLIHTSATGRDVTRLACQQTLTKFSADDTPIEDAFLATLAGCPNLQHLSLTRVRISDLGIEHFRKHPRLFFINLGVSTLTDASLDVAATIPNLKHFLVSRGMTKQGYKEFQAKRPDVQL